MSNSKLLLVTAFCSLLGGTALIANTFTVTDESDFIYGKGVHAFFDRDYEEAITILLQAEEIKSNDPRPFYFLGLAYLRQEKTEQADQYFEKAAQLEYSGRAARDYGISEALRRIQGEERLRIERIRSEERTNARTREQQLREARYGRENAADRESLRQLAPQNQREDLAVLQRMAGNIGENAFGVRPMNPINTAEASVVARRGGANPFGDVVINISEVSAVSEPTAPTVRSPAAPARTERTFVNVDVNVAEQGNQSASGMNPVRSTQAAVAKEVGRSLGALFSRKATTE